MEVLSRPLPGWLSTPLLSPPCFRLRPCYHPHPHIGRITQGGNMMEASQAVRPHHQDRTLSTFASDGSSTQSRNLIAKSRYLNHHKGQRLGFDDIHAKN